MHKRVRTMVGLLLVSVLMGHVLVATASAQPANFNGQGKGSANWIKNVYFE